MPLRSMARILQRRHEAPVPRHEIASRQLVPTTLGRVTAQYSLEAVLVVLGLSLLAAGHLDRSGHQWIGGIRHFSRLSWSIPDFIGYRPSLDLGTHVPLRLVPSLPQHLLAAQRLLVVTHIALPDDAFNVHVSGSGRRSWPMSR